jgi:hypothetical protein
MKKFAFATLASVAVIAASPATAATVIFESTFEGTNNSDNLRTGANDPGTAPGAGQWSTHLQADGWTATNPANHTLLAGINNPIELQNNVAGAPAANGGKIFVELDSLRNSAMSRTLTTSSQYFSLSFLYSPRPNQAIGTNGIEVLLNGVQFSPPGVISAAGGANTSWSAYSIGRFAANAGDVITFRAVGGNDSLGGYVDNIKLGVVPEPATWAFMILGFGMVGGAMRSRKANVATGLRFA